MVSTREILKESKNSDQPVIIVCPDEARIDFIVKEIIEIFEIKGENITSYIAGEGVKILREKINGLFARPLNLGKKILFVHLSDSLSREEANTLLRVLEEPPEFSRIFLFCASLAKVIPTIRSRCKKLIIGSAESIAQDNILDFFQDGNFNAYLRKIKDVESGDIPAILESILREIKNRRMGEVELKLYKKVGETFLLVSKTNCSRKLAMEELFIWWKAQNK